MLLEETSAGGAASDSFPMSLYKLLKTIEERGVVDYTVTGHKVMRPGSVQRGETPDTFTITHESHSVFRPNPVAVKNVKGSNVAGYLGTKALSSSKFLKCVWRPLADENVFGHELTIVT